MAAIRKAKLAPTQPRPRRWGILGAIAVILLIAAFVGIRPYWRLSSHFEDVTFRRPVTLKEVSPDLINSILAAEDETFFHHAGISPTGIARAVWVDLRGKGRRQGGSTLTQQLVKNLYLTQEKTLTRKSQEVLLAVLLEMRYPKKKILEAYLNEIYLGGGNGVSLVGVG